MSYRCSCGDKSKITFHKFRMGRRCRKCGFEKISGKNNWKYNPNLTDEEREANKTRHSDPNYIRWRKKVFRKDSYICQKCSQKGGQLNAHHIESWASNKKLRLVEFNGITFCFPCHIKFHSIYGKKNVNKRQLNEFLNYNIM